MLVRHCHSIVTISHPMIRQDLTIAHVVHLHILSCFMSDKKMQWDLLTLCLKLPGVCQFFYLSHFNCVCITHCGRQYLCVCVSGNVINTQSASELILLRNPWTRMHPLKCPAMCSRLAVYVVTLAFVPFSATCELCAAQMQLLGIVYACTCTCRLI